MKTKTISAERTDSGYWLHEGKLSGTLPDVELSVLLKWLLQQLYLGNFDEERDAEGAVVTIVIGRAAAGTHSLEEAHERATINSRNLNFAEVFAKARESGVEPKFAKWEQTVQADMAGRTLPRMYTELYYAFELMKALARIRERSLPLAAPAIVGTASAATVRYLREATRCYLYGLHIGAVAVSRACMEEALRSRIDQENWRARGHSRSRTPGAARPASLTFSSRRQSGWGI